MNTAKPRIVWRNLRDHMGRVHTASGPWIPACDPSFGDRHAESRRQSLTTTDDDPNCWYCIRLRAERKAV